ncbi:MAG: DUF1080 domain-containing protein [Lentisphaerae bacterium]|nr:DUF1080 domain-containing protein [Lentisphaerota bacterium]
MKTALAAVVLCAAGAMAAEVDLLAGGGLDAWRAPTGEWAAAGDVAKDEANPKALASKPGAGAIVNGAKGRTSNLLSKQEWGDVEVHVEFLVPEKSNSGVYLMARYEIQVFDSFGVKEPHHSDCGGIYQRWADNRGFEGKPPRVNAAKKPGEWQTFDITFRAPRFDAAGRKTANARFVKVVHNGTVIHENEEVTGPTRASTWNDEKPLGPLMLQGDHGPVAYRNLKVRTLAEK